MRKSLAASLAAAMLGWATFSGPVMAAPTPTDKTPPAAVSINPANGSTNVLISIQPSIRWSEKLNTTSITYTFKNITTSKATNVPTTVVYDSTTFTVTIKPNTPLSYLNTYSATMKVKDVAGNTSANISWSFKTQAAPPPPNQAPVAKLALTPTSGDAPLTVNANASQSTDDVAVTSYTFDFGDGTIVGPQSGATSNHIYPNPGNYTVKVTVKDAGGLSSSATANVAVNTPPPPPNNAPVAKLVATPDNGETPVNTILDASGSTDTDTFPIATYTFDFGDGSVSDPQASPQITHTFTNIQAYTVTVTVTDTAGLTSTSSVQIQVYGPNQAPVAQLSVTPATPNAPVVVTADASASTDDRGNLSYVFDFGDGTVTAPQTTPKADHRFGSQGSYVITTTVTDNGGLSSTASFTLNVGAPPTPPTNDLTNPSAEISKTTGCPLSTTTGSGGVNWTICPTFWFSAAHGGGVNTSVYEYSTDAHTGSRSLKINGSGFGSNCYIGAKQPGETRPACGTAAWNYTPTPVTAGGHYLYTDWYKSDADTEIDSTVVYADGTFGYFYLGTVSPAASWTPLRLEFDVPLANAAGSPAAKMSVYHLVYQNTTLTIDDMFWGKYTASPFTRGLVSVTMDDGFANQYTDALPILNKYSVKGTYYVITSEFNDQPKYMTPAQIRDVKAAGQDVQSHTVTHPNLTKLNPDSLDTELKSSQQTINNAFGGPIGDIAAPYGAQNTDVVANAQKYYQSLRTTDKGYNSRDYLDPYRLRVQNIKNTTTVAQVQSWIAQASQDHTWLILVYHQVTSDTSQGTYSTLPTDFDSEMSAIASSQLTSMTVSQALHETAPQAGVVLNPVPPVDAELISNNGVETPTVDGTAAMGWLKGTWGTNTPTFSWVSDAHTGVHANRVDIANWIDGQAKWYFPAVGVQGGKRYEFTDWYKSNVSSTVSVAYTMSDGTVHFDGQDFAVAPASTWTQYKIGVVLPPDAVNAFFSHGINANGWLETDDYSMKLGTVDAGLTRGIVSLTFDDASASIYNALPTVEAYGWRTTQYIPTDGLNNWTWTTAQVQSVYNRGHEIAAHSESHPYLTKVSDSQLNKELCGSKSVLEKMINHPVNSFSSPYGDYDARVVQAIKDCGFTSHRSVDVGYNTRYDMNPYNIHVENILATTTLAEYNSWVNEAVQGHYWLVIVYHEVMDGSTGDAGLDKYTVTPALFAQELASVQASGISVQTVTQALGEVTPQKVTW